MPIDPAKLRALRQQAIAERLRRTPSPAELYKTAVWKHAIRLKSRMEGIAQQLEKSARAGHACQCVLIGYRDEPEYREVLAELKKAGLNVREEKIKTSGWLSGKRSIVVYL